MSTADFCGTLADKNDFLLLACTKSDSDPDKELVVGFVNYYFMWYLPKASAIPRVDTPASVTSPGLDPPCVAAVPSVYIAVLQAIKKTTHAEAVARGVCGESEPNTGAVLACLALAHAVHSGMAIALLDSTPSAVSFYTERFGFTLRDGLTESPLLPMYRLLSDFEPSSVLRVPAVPPPALVCVSDLDNDIS